MDKEIKNNILDDDALDTISGGMGELGNQSADKKDLPCLHVLLCPYCRKEILYERTAPAFCIHCGKWLD